MLFLHGTFAYDVFILTRHLIAYVAYRTPRVIFYLFNLIFWSHTPKCQRICYLV